MLHIKNRRILSGTTEVIRMKKARRGLVGGLIFALCHCVEFLGEFRLLVSCVVLVNETASNCLVKLLNSELIKFGSRRLVACFNSSVILLDYSLKLALNHLVLKCLSLVDKNTLLSGLNISHFSSPYKFSVINAPLQLQLRGSVKGYFAT